MPEYMSATKFRVLMNEFAAAIGVVETQSRVVHDNLAGITRDLRSVSSLWQSPAAMTFEPLRVEFQRSSDDLEDVLAGILHRMRITYQNYLDVERRAVQNLTADQGGGP